MEQEPLLDLSLMYGIFDTYREKVLAGCPEGSAFEVEVVGCGIVTIEFKRNTNWFHSSSFYRHKIELIQSLYERLTDLGWSVDYEVVPIK